MAVADEISAGAVALINGLALAGVTVRDRKIPAAVEAEVSAVVTVSVAEDGTEFETADDDAGVAGRYRLVVSIARRSAGALSGAATMRDIRQAIRRETLAIDGLSGAVPAVDWADALPSPQFDAGMLDDGWDYGFLAFSVKTREPRA